MRNNIRQSSLVVGHLVAEPAARMEGYLKVGTMPDGTAVRLPVVLINGRHPGKTLYIQAISDGDELNGIAVIHKILRTITPEQLHGKIIAVPIVNFHAFHAKQAFSPVDNRKMNRCFPGRRDGTSSERIAYHLFHQAVQQADYCLDLHQGGVQPMIDEVRVRVDQKHTLHKACLELARVFGIGHILDQKGPKGQLAQAAPEVGIPTIDPELGGTHGWDAASIEKGVRGVRNVLQYYQFISGTPEIPEQQIVVKKFATLVSNEGGFIYYRAELYEHLTASQPVADICDVFGNVRETVTSPIDGVFWSKPIYPMVASGGIVGKIGTPIHSL
ncbi:MAG: succinylglutamate desuccinylase/aspartoacylase family protein [Candidatus Poribacteria bacterium]|nr:succinylglutamate desuccinylase/aspartoacylase family protein [Candidatus Poribacteria bacterium]